MFETSVIQGHAPVAHGRAGSFTVSLLAHSAVIAGAIALSVATTEFPAAAPAEFALFVPVQPPPPLGTPDGGAAPRRPEPPQPRPEQPAPPPDPQTAPALVPETSTPLEPAGTGPADAPATGQGVGPAGVPWGTENSIGELDAPPAPVDIPAQPEPEARVYQAHEVEPPVLLHKVEPRYPNSVIRTGVSTQVVVRCIIGKNGSVRNPEVVVGSYAPFNAAVVNAVSQWRYKPATYAARPVDSYLTLTVTFNVRR